MVNNLLSGLFGSVIVFFIGLWFKHRETDNKLQSISLLLFFEVNDHLYWLNNLNEMTVELLINTKDIEWEKSRYFFATNISYEDFSLIIKHYRSMRAVRKLLSVAQNPIALPDEFRQKHLFYAQAAHKLLFNLAKLDEQKLIDYNTLPPMK